MTLPIIFLGTCLATLFAIGITNITDTADIVRLMQ